jgi:hypothetical protein
LHLSCRGPSPQFNARLPLDGHQFLICGIECNPSDSVNKSHFCGIVISMLHWVSIKWVCDARCRYASWQPGLSWGPLLQMVVFIARV